MEHSYNGELSVKLSWDTVLAQFDNLIKFAARQQIQNNTTDTMLSAEDLYQDGMIKLYDCWKIWCVDEKNNKDMDEFAPIFKTSLFRAMKNKTKSNSAPVFIDLEGDDNTLGDLIQDPNAEDPVERMYREHGIEHLRGILTSDISKVLLDELVDPSERTLYEVWADIKRKEMIKAQGKKVNIPKDNTVRMKHIIRSLGITGKQYDVAIAEIREKSKFALQM